MTKGKTHQTTSSRTKIEQLLSTPFLARRFALVRANLVPSLPSTQAWSSFVHSARVRRAGC